MPIDITMHLVKSLIYEIGTYSFDDPRRRINRQFDVVTRDRNGYISYECKYSSSPVSVAVYREEEYQVRDCGLPFYDLGFSSRAGFTREMRELSNHLIELKDMYADELGGSSGMNHPD